MGLRVTFWNIENFAGNWDRLETVTREIASFRPHVFCFAEIKDKASMRYLIRQVFDGYDFGLTDGAGGIELLVGWRRGYFEHALYTQRREFRAGSTFLRPGALVSLMKGGQYYNLLFMHADSGTALRDYNNRQEMFAKVWKLKDALDGIEGRFTDVRFLVMGDLNTMGHAAADGQDALDGATEIADLARDAEANGMRLLDKTSARTNAFDRDAQGTYRYSNLDHALASENLAFVPLTAPGGGAPASVRVAGWAALPEAEQDDFIQTVSDHTPISVEIDLPQE